MLLSELTCTCVSLHNDHMKRSLSELYICYYLLEILTSPVVLLSKKEHRVWEPDLLPKCHISWIIRPWEKCINLLILNVVYHHSNISEFILHLWDFVLYVYQFSVRRNIYEKIYEILMGLTVKLCIWKAEWNYSDNFNVSLELQALIDIFLYVFSRYNVRTDQPTWPSILF
jgi:hypothetical protein